MRALDLDRAQAIFEADGDTDFQQEFMQYILMNSKERMAVY